MADDSPGAHPTPVRIVRKKDTRDGLQLMFEHKCGWDIGFFYVKRA